MINIVLYEPEIPGNTGNIMRTCVATNSRLHLIEPLGFKITDKTIKRSGVNYIDKLDYIIYSNFQEFKEKNPGEYFFYTRYGKKAHTEFDYSDKENLYLIFGKESTGIPKEILKNNLNRCIRIPTSPNVRALNLSNCVAIATYEVLRQKNYPYLSKVETQKGENWILE
ncbi:MAG: tRNA (cytidine(34)-2'-O)-methyltransferase [Bacilli bacterium]|nr:tRNA (cytidine(34)-2'-O)-methyltransferase [Bacilli bacterium]